MKHGANQYHMVEFQPRDHGLAVGPVQTVAIAESPGEWLRKQKPGSLTLLASWQITRVMFEVIEYNEIRRNHGF